MKIALFGASGMIGTRLLAEALGRGHEVTAIVRNPERIEKAHDNLTVKAGDASDAAQVALLADGHDIIIASIAPDFQNLEAFAPLTETLIEGAKSAGVPRLIFVGGAGSLEVAPGVQLVDTSAIPDEWKPAVLMQRAALNIFRAEKELNWTYFSPAGVISPGERTGKFRLGKDQVVADDEGNSAISCEDYAIALLDEVENPQHSRQRFTIGY